MRLGNNSNRDRRGAATDRHFRTILVKGGSIDGPLHKGAEMAEEKASKDDYLRRLVAGRLRF
jgi:hypothetical protein